MAKAQFEAELIGATDLARQALLEITPADTIGEPAGHEVDASGAVTLFFTCTMPGYPGWRWAASVAKVAKDAPVTVLEVEMLPSEGALLSPDWLPWSMRLAQYQEAQAALEAEQKAAAEALGELGDDDDLDEDDLDLDEDDLDDDDDDDDDLDDEDDLDEDDEDDDDDLDEDDILVNDFSDFDDEIDGVDIDALADEIDEAEPTNEKGPED